MGRPHARGTAVTGPAQFWVATGERPVTLNAERKASKWARSAAARTWKTATAEALLEHQLTKLRYERVDIRIRPFYPAKSGHLPDTGGLQPTEKAIVDALVEAELIPDDNRHHVRSITSEAPDIFDSLDHPSLMVRIEPAAPAPGHPLRRVCSCAPTRRKTT